MTSAQSHIQVAAKEHITLTSGGGYIRIQGGNIEIHCPGTVSFKAGNFLLDGPASMDVPLPEMLRIEDIPERQHAIRYRFVDRVTGLPSARYRYRIHSTCGKTLEGVTDEDGWAQVLHTRESEIASAWVAEFPVEMDPIARGHLR